MFKISKNIATSLLLSLTIFSSNAEATLKIKDDDIVVEEKDKSAGNKDKDEDESMFNQKLEQNTELTTSTGSTFMVEKGWYATQNNNKIILQEPEQELSVTLIENTEKSAEDAANSAWKKVQPNFDRVVQHVIKEVPQDGWDEIIQFIYETSSQENRFVFAIARRVGTTWYLILIDGTKAAFDRRMAGVLLINSSFKVPGIQKESFANKKAHTLNEIRLNELMTFVEEVQKLCKVPGIAIGIVQDGKLILEQALGVKEVGKNEKVNPKTLFMIGSVTKALTTLMMARLVDECKFEWETPVTQIMPDFALADASITKQMLMKYTVSASTGMSRQDIECLFNYDHATPEQRIKEMRDMKPTTKFGETFQYSNSMVSAGGYIAAHALDKNNELGKAYDITMQSKIFGPLKMSSTTFDFAQVEKTDHATPHGFTLKNTVKPFHISDERWVESVRPAGGAWSNVYDMAQYIITELNKGINAQGKLVISEINLLKRREPQIKITDQINYGLGLMMENDHGVLVVGHDGMTMGFSSLMFFLPEHNVGLVMLTNVRGVTLFAQAVKRKFMELLFDGKPQALEMVKVGIEQQNKMFAKNLEDISFTPNSEWIKQFLGTYKQSVLGEINIREAKNNKVELDARVWKSTLGQKKDSDGTLKLILTDLPFAGIELLPQQRNENMQLILISGQHKYVFEKIIK